MDLKEFYKLNQQLQDKNRSLDDELRRFNWGAFGFGWIWGLFNGSFKQMFIPWIFLYIASRPFHEWIWWCVCAALMLWYGFYGNKWAWNNKPHRNLEEFTRIQKFWAIGAIVEFSIFAIILGVIFATIEYM